MQRAFIGTAEAANRGEVGLDEVLAIVLKYEAVVLNRYSRFSGASVVGVLEQLGQNMPWALHLLEELVSRPGKLRVRLKLIPALGRAFLEVARIVRFARQTTTLFYA